MALLLVFPGFLPLGWVTTLLPTHITQLIRKNNSGYPHVRVIFNYFAMPILGSSGNSFPEYFGNAMLTRVTDALLASN